MEIWYGTSPPCEVVAVAYTSAVPKVVGGAVDGNLATLGNRIGNTGFCFRQR